MLTVHLAAAQQTTKAHALSQGYQTYLALQASLGCAACGMQVQLETHRQHYRLGDNTSQAASNFQAQSLTPLP